MAGLCLLLLPLPVDSVCFLCVLGLFSLPSHVQVSYWVAASNHDFLARFSFFFFLNLNLRFTPYRSILAGPVQLYTGKVNTCSLRLRLMRLSPIHCHGSKSACCPTRMCYRSFHLCGCMHHAHHTIFIIAFVAVMICYSSVLYRVQTTARQDGTDKFERGT